MGAPTSSRSSHSSPPPARVRPLPWQWRKGREQGARQGARQRNAQEGAGKEAHGATLHVV